MQITKVQRGDIVELHITGRLDGYWAEHLSTGLADVVREGGHQIRVNLSDVSFLSSAGIRVLVQCFKQLRAIDGSLAVWHPSQQVSEVLKLAGLDTLLISTLPLRRLPGAASNGTRWPWTCLRFLGTGR